MRRLTKKDNRQRTKYEDEPVPDFYELDQDRPLPETTPIAHPTTCSLIPQAIAAAAASARSQNAENIGLIDLELALLENRRAEILRIKERARRNSPMANAALGSLDREDLKALQNRLLNGAERERNEPISAPSSSSFLSINNIFLQHASISSTPTVLNQSAGVSLGLPSQFPSEAPVPASHPNSLATAPNSNFNSLVGRSIIAALVQQAGLNTIRMLGQPRGTSPLLQVRHSTGANGLAGQSILGTLQGPFALGPSAVTLYDPSFGAQSQHGASAVAPFSLVSGASQNNGLRQLTEAYLANSDDLASLVALSYSGVGGFADLSRRN
jgi:hypothetical protein